MFCFLYIVLSDEGQMPTNGVYKNQNRLINNSVLQRPSGNKDNNIEEPAMPLESQPAPRTMLQVSV